MDSYANDLEADESALDEKSADSGLDMLMKSVPGVPGEDYPILAEAPETEFSCEGQVNGGMSHYYFRIKSLSTNFFFRFVIRCSFVVLAPISDTG